MMATSTDSGAANGELYGVWVAIGIISVALLVASVCIVVKLQTPRRDTFTRSPRQLKWKNTVFSVVSVSILLTSLVWLLVSVLDMYSVNHPAAVSIRNFIDVVYSTVMLYALLAILGVFLLCCCFENGSFSIGVLLLEMFLVVWSLLFFGTLFWCVLYPRHQTMGTEWLKPFFHEQSTGFLEERIAGEALGFALLLGWRNWLAVTLPGLASAPFKIYRYHAEVPECAPVSASTPVDDATVTEFDELDRQLKIDLMMLQQDLYSRKFLWRAHLRATTTKLKKLPTAMLQWMRGAWRLPIAVVCAILSLLIVVSIFITVVDKFAHSNYHRGFVLTTPVLFNPLDKLLQLTSELAPLDYILFSVIVGYLTVTSMHPSYHTRVNVGSSLSAVETCLFLGSFAVSAISVLVSLFAIAPQYSTFAGQTYTDPATGLSSPCTLERAAAGDSCQLTRLAYLVNSLFVTMPISAVLTLVVELVFCIAFPFAIKSAYSQPAERH